VTSRRATARPQDDEVDSLLARMPRYIGARARPTAMMRAGAPARSRCDARTHARTHAEIERYLASVRGIRAISNGGKSRRSLAYSRGWSVSIGPR